MKFYLSLISILCLFSFNLKAEETPEISPEEAQRIEDCQKFSDAIYAKRYEIATPNEKTVARKFYYEKIEKLIKKYIATENKELLGLYYSDILNNKRPLLLAKVKEIGFCNYSYFVYFDLNDNIRRLVNNNNRDYALDFDGNYKLFCKGESSEEIIKIKGVNYLVSKNHGGRINRADKIVAKDGDLSLENVCLF